MFKKYSSYFSFDFNANKFTVAIFAALVISGDVPEIDLPSLSNLKNDMKLIKMMFKDVFRQTTLTKNIVTQQFWHVSQKQNRNEIFSYNRNNYLKSSIEISF